MKHFCYVVVDSDGNSRFIAGDPDLVYGVDWRENEHDVIVKWEEINRQGTALARLIESGWTPVRETPMAPEWTKNKSGVSHCLVILQKENA